MPYVPHQILVRTREGVWEASRRLREHGYTPTVDWRKPEGVSFMVRFEAPPEEKVEFLRPDILPPLGT